MPRSDTSIRQVAAVVPSAVTRTSWSRCENLTAFAIRLSSDLHQPPLVGLDARPGRRPCSSMAMPCLAAPADADLAGPGPPPFG